MSKRTKEVVDDNPEWGEAEFARARPASEVLPGLLGAEAAQKVLRPRGRPRLENAKRPVKLRIDPEVIDAYKAQGDGWQTRMNEALRAYAKSHGMLR
jgi:uncharacterized protein (DUF4415 family)